MVEKSSRQWVEDWSDEKELEDIRENVKRMGYIGGGKPEFLLEQIDLMESKIKNLQWQLTEYKAKEIKDFVHGKD